MTGPVVEKYVLWGDGLPIMPAGVQENNEPQ